MQAPTAALFAASLLLLGGIALAAPQVAWGGQPSSSLATGTAAPGPATAVPSVTTNTCPNSYFYGSSTQMSLQNTVDCAGSAGFTGNLEITFVSMAYQESSFCPGAIEGGSGTCFYTGPGCGSGNANAEGILQQGTAGQCPPVGGPFSVSGYSPSSCSTWSGSSSDWGGIYFNPLCSFQWALAYYNANGYGFWGSYLSGAYCNWAPNGFLGTGSVTCSGTNQNQANLPWSTVCPNNVCPSTSPLTASYAMLDQTTSTGLTCGATFTEGDSIQFTATGNGGTPPYTYAWKYGDGATGAGTPVTHKYTATGTVDPTMTVTDSSGATYTTGTGCSFTVVAPPTPTISSFTVSPTTLTLGARAYANVTASGGTPPYTYAFTGLPAGCSSANTSHLVCTPTVTGSFTITAKVVDHRAQTASKSAALSVDAPLVLSAFSVSPSTLTLGGSVTLWANVTGGASPYAYAYSGLPSGCASVDAATFTCTPTSTGSFSLIVQVTDASSQTITGSIPLLVNAVSSGSLSVRAFTAVPSTVPLGGTTYLNVSVVGGSIPYTFSFQGLPSGCLSANTATLSCTPTAAGSFDVGAKVVDASGSTVSVSVPLTVSAPAGYPALTSFTATPASVRVGSLTSLAAVASGGAPPYSYQYLGLPGGCASQNTSALRCAPTTAGSFLVQVSVTDTAAHAVMGWLTLTVLPSLVPLTINSFTVNPNPTTMGTPVQFSVTVSGGGSPYSAVYRGLPPGCGTVSSLSWTCTPTTVGSYAISVNVTDAWGDSALSQLTLVVNGTTAAPSHGGTLPFGLSALTVWPMDVVVIGLLAAVVIAAVAIRHRRHRTPPPAQEPYRAEPEWAAPSEPVPAETWGPPPEWSP